MHLTDGHSERYRNENLILKDYSSKSSVKDVTDFVIENLVYKPACNNKPKLIVFLTNYHGVSKNCPRIRGVTIKFLECKHICRIE
jgi:hypothetical protein